MANAKFKVGDIIEPKKNAVSSNYIRLINLKKLIVQDTAMHYYNGRRSICARIEEGMSISSGREYKVGDNIYVYEDSFQLVKQSPPEEQDYEIY